MSGWLVELLNEHQLPAPPSDDRERVDRISAEAVRMFEALADVRKAVSVFASAQEGPARSWGDLARDVAGHLARDGFAVITGGGPGLMAAANEGAEAADGASLGLTISLPTQEHPNDHLTLHVPFHYFFLRKLAFVKYACAFVCLPGGFGTLDELFEALNLRKTHKVDPFPVILMGTSYWSGLLAWLRDVAVPAGALDPEDVDRIILTDDPEEVASLVRSCHEELCVRLGISAESATDT